MAKKLWYCDFFGAPIDGYDTCKADNAGEARGLLRCPHCETGTEECGGPKVMKGVTP